MISKFIHVFGLVTIFIVTVVEVVLGISGDTLDERIYSILVFIFIGVFFIGLARIINLLEKIADKDIKEGV